MKKNKKPESKPKRNKILDIFLLISFTILLIFLTTSKLTNEDDYFWHLATGRFIVQNHSIPSQDIFSYPTLGEPWLVTEWGWDVLTYFIFSSTGFLGLSILNTLVFLVIFCSYFFILRKFKANYSLIVLFFFLFVFGIFERLTPRPHIISYLFIVILLSLLINYKYFDRKSYKYLFVIPFIFLLWANMHMGCLIGFFVFVVFMAVEFIIYLKPKIFSSKEIVPFSKNELIKILVVFICSVLAMLINPHGLNTFLESLTSQANAKALYVSVMEWISPFNPRVTGKFYINIYIFFLVGYLPVLIYSIKKKDLFAGVLCFLFAVNSLRALRFTVDYLIIFLPFFVVSVKYLIDNIRNSKIKEYLTVKPVLNIILIIIMILIIINIPGDKFYHRTLVYARFAGIGLDENYYPVKMFDFIKQNKINEIGSKPFNTFEIGGYFLWNFPGQKDFFDSRDLNDFIMNEYQTIISRLPGYENKIKEYDFDYAICVIPDIASEPQLMKKCIISYFATHNEEWKLVYWNDHSLLFLKNLPKFSQIIAENEYKFFTPYNIYFQKSQVEKGLQEDMAEIQKEIDKKQNEDPNSIFLNNFLAMYGNRIY